MTSAPIVLVPGFWLGAWAWDDVADRLLADGHRVTALTLPGLESLEADRSAVTLADHVDAICAAVADAASDRMPEQIAAMVYVDSGPATGSLDPDLEGPEKPVPSREQLAEDENLDGLSDEQLQTFMERAVPEPGGVVRADPGLRNHARLDVPTVAVCTGFASDVYKEAVQEGATWLAGFGELRNLRWIDLPTSHWPMWSRPKDLAALIADVALDPSGSAREA